MLHRAPAKTGIARSRVVRARGAAFTMLEMVIVIAIIGFVAAVLLGGVSLMISDTPKDPPREVLRKALDAAWYASATGHGRFSLDYDEEANALVVRPVAGVLAADSISEENSDTEETDGDETEAVPESDADPADSADEGVQRFPFDDSKVTAVRFTRAPDEGKGSLQATTEVSYPSLFFSPWGGCTPAIIEMEIDGKIYRYRLEVFSGGLEDIKE